MPTYIRAQTQTDQLIGADADVHDVNTAQPQLSKCKNTDLNSMQNVQRYEIYKKYFVTPNIFKHVKMILEHILVILNNKPLNW